jgi:PII-like signaling protein
MIGGMATLERAAVIMYRKKDQPRPALDLAGELKPLSTVPHIEPGSHMTVNTNGVLLRVFIGESDKFEHKPLFEAIVQKARDLGLAGATVLRGSEGFGANSVIHKASLLQMSADLPIVIEIVDTEEKIKLLQPHLETMVREGMITIEYVVILMYRSDAR